MRDNLPDLPEFSNIHKQELVQQHMALSESTDAILKREALENLLIWNQFVLNVEQGVNGKPLADFHWKLCNFVTDNKHKKKLILIPRGHLKSTLVTIGYATQQIVKNPNVRILIRNATWQMAVDFLTEIKRHLRENQELIRLFGNVTIDAEEWSADRILLKRTDTNIKGPTVWATGIESNLVGSHPDIIIDDDLVNRENTNTPDQIEKVILRYKDTLDLLEPGGQYILIGTRWTEGDLYSWILDKENDIRQGYEIMIERAYKGNLETGEDFVPIWPEKFNQNELLTRLREKGWFQFSAQYLNDPVPDEAATFKRSWYRYFDVEDLRGKELTKVITIDPAISVAKDADYTAMIVTGIDQWGNLFVLDMVRGRWTPNDVIKNIFTLSELWHPRQIGLETVAYQKALAYFLREEMQRRGRFLPIYELLPQERSKDQRIKGLQPLYENGKVFHRNKHPTLMAFEGELSSFPRGAHDDLIDAFSYALDLVVPPKKKQTRYRHHYLYGPSHRE